MLHPPFYDPGRSYEENFKDGPFGALADGQIFNQTGRVKHNFLGQKVFTPFGIAAGPLVNGRFVKEALNKGFDICTYKTVRTAKYPCHPWPNVVSLDIKENITLKMAEVGVKVKKDYSEPLSITNSFGVPSMSPDFWQKDMAECVSFAKEGQAVVGSFQGTPRGDAKSYVQDFADCARLVKETGAKILEVNLSCPNEGTAHLLCFDLERVKEVVEAIKNAIGNLPLIIKIAYFQDQEQLKKLINLVGGAVQGIEAINTIPAKIVDETDQQALPGPGRLFSGVCGSGIKWAGLEMVKRLKELREKFNLSYSIIGVGGVMNPQDYMEYRKAGADAVMSVTGAMWNPFLAQEIKRLNYE